MTDDPDTQRLLGRLEQHLENSGTQMSQFSDTLTKIDTKLDGVSHKASKAHERLDKHEVRFSTLKYVAGLVAAFVAWVSGFFEN